LHCWHVGCIIQRSQCLSRIQSESMTASWFRTIDSAGVIRHRPTFPVVLEINCKTKPVKEEKMRLSVTLLSAFLPAAEGKEPTHVRTGCYAKTKTRTVSLSFIAMLFVSLAIFSSFDTALASDSYLVDINNAYGRLKNALGTDYTCKVCHTTDNPGPSTRNPFGTAWASTGGHLIPINATLAALDTDGDGFSNAAELSAGKYPGDANSKPSGGDTTAPSISTFTVPAASNSLTVSGISISATDAVGVTAYVVTESATAPATGWVTVTSTTSFSTTTASYPATTPGAKTLYAFARDAANNVSAASPGRSVTITLPDTTAPSISTFTVPGTSGSLTVSGISITATDAVGVTAYVVTESATAPATGWVTVTSTTSFSTTTASYTATTSGLKTLRAFARDAANNVSAASTGRSVTITLPDTTRPNLTAFTVPAASNSLTVSGISISATDAVGVTAYVVTESATAPATGWVTVTSTTSFSTTTASYTATTPGAKTLYAFARDAANNVSAASPGRLVTITVAGAVASYLVDFDGDGNADILWQHTSGAVAIWLMDGSTIVSVGMPGTVSSAWQISGLADFDGDGKTDILWREGTSGTVAIWLMNGTAIASVGVAGALNTNWQIAGVGDYDADGKADILWQEATTGEVALWFMNGAAVSGTGSAGTVGSGWQIMNR
jgi:hypothetical protein